MHPQVIKAGPNKRVTVLLSSCFYTVLIAIKYIEVHSYLEKDGARRKSQQILPEVWAKKEVLLDSGYSFNSHTRSIVVIFKHCFELGKS